MNIINKIEKLRADYDEITGAIKGSEEEFNEIAKQYQERRSSLENSLVLMQGGYSALLEIGMELGVVDANGAEIVEEDKGTTAIAADAEVTKKPAKKKV